MWHGSQGQRGVAERMRPGARRGEARGPGKKRWACPERDMRRKEADAMRPRAGDGARKPGAEGCGRKNEARGKEG